MLRRKNEMDMTQGPILKNMIVYCIPIMLTSLLQMLYNAADMMVVGQFAGAQALAAVGATSYITSLLINLFVGLSSGTSVKVSQYFGAKKEKDISETVHTSIAISLVTGVVLVFVGLLFSRTCLEWMDTPADVIDLSTKYMTIIFLGMPGQMVYNFAAAILRSVGDSKRPLYILTISGGVNVVLNLIFVVCFGMDVDGVALATILSQYLSAVMVMVCLIKEKGIHRFVFQKLRIHGKKLLEIIHLGLPTGIQGSLVAVASVLVQSSINSFGSATVAACTASSNIENLIYLCINAFPVGAGIIMGQNVGARKIERFHRVTLTAAGIVNAVAIVLSVVAIVFARPLLSIYTSEPEVIAIGVQRLVVVSASYILAGNLDVLSAGLRGMGYSVGPSALSVLGTCGIRILWIYTVFAWYPTVPVLHFAFGVSWAVTGMTFLIYYLVGHRKLVRKIHAEQKAEESL